MISRSKFFHYICTKTLPASVNPQCFWIAAMKITTVHTKMKTHPVNSLPIVRTVAIAIWPSCESTPADCKCMRIQSASYLVGLGSPNPWKQDLCLRITTRTISPRGISQFPQHRHGVTVGPWGAPAADRNWEPGSVEAARAPMHTGKSPVIHHTQPDTMVQRIMGR